MDVWYSSLLFNLFIIHVMLPFNRSDLNIFALGGLLKRTQAHVDEAYLISALGYAFILVGGQLWCLNLGVGLREGFDRLVELPSHAAYFLLSNKALLIANGAAAVLLMTGVLLYYFETSGFGFNLRNLLLVTPWLRPVGQFSAFLGGLVGAYCLARYVEHRERSMLIITVLIMIGFLFFGERGNIFALPTLVISVLFLRLGRRIKLYWLALGTAAALLLVFVLDALRSPHFSLGAVLEGFFLSFFYGNSFSDTRDFAVVLSFWDGHLFMGLTYLAGLLAFVPRFLFSFRDTWSAGVVTATMAGLSPKEHPGLRVGLFGEAYLNFGLFGVVLLGMLLGAVTRLIDLRMKQAIRLRPAYDMRVYSYALILTFVGFAQNSVAGSTIYSILVILLVSWLSWRTLRWLRLIA